MRTKLFISHATPEDNEFTKWLALKLISLGYDVWCDVLFLEKGIDFWSSIESEIRENAIKFLLISSSHSNQRQGVLKELAVAEKVKKQLNDPTFIIPLAIDENLSYDDINIDIVRLNSISFKKSWATGLQDLVEALDTQQVPKNEPNPTQSGLIYQQIFLHNKGVIEKEEIYDSNWFSVESFPEELRFHDFSGLMPRNYDTRQLTFPAIKFRNYLCTFAWAYDFMGQLPKTETYMNSKTIAFPTKQILSNELDSEFISSSQAQRLIVQLMNIAFEKRMKQKEITEYQMSGRLSFWFEKGALEKDKSDKVLMVGKQKDKHWHYAISGSAKLYPFPVLMISSHIVFTEDGKKLIDSKSIQHSARRKQGKNWWNETWRNKLLAFVKFLSEDGETFYLEMGDEEKVVLSCQSLKFRGNVSYEIPEKNALVEEVEFENDFEEEI